MMRTNREVLVVLDDALRKNQPAVLSADEWERIRIVIHTTGPAYAVPGDIFIGKVGLLQGIQIVIAPDTTTPLVNA